MKRSKFYSYVFRNWYKSYANPNRHLSTIHTYLSASQIGIDVALVVIQADENVNFPDESASVQYCTISDSLDIVSTGSLNGISMVSVPVPMLLADSTFIAIFARILK